MDKNSVAYAPLAFVRAALCPLEFRCTKLGDDPSFGNIVAEVPAFGELEVGECLRYESLFPYCDRNKHRRIASQIVTTPFGLSPQDIDVLFGMCTYLRGLKELPKDLEVKFTTDFLGRLAGLSRTSTKDYRRIQSRVFRLSYVKLTNSAVWNSASKSFESLSNFELFSIRSMPLLTESCQPVTLRLSPEFARLLRETPAMAFDPTVYGKLRGSAKRRFFLLVSREGWIGRDSTMYDADAFTIHQLGYSRCADPQKDRIRRKDRLHSLRELMRDFESRDLIRPYKPWNGYFGTPERGALKGRLALRWSRGPAVRTKRSASSAAAKNLEHDALYDQVKRLRDQHGKPIVEPAYRSLLAKHGRDRLQKHVEIVLVQRELLPGSFKKSEVATFVNRVQENHAPPSWFGPQLRKPAMAFEQIEASSVAESLYQSISRSI